MKHHFSKCILLVILLLFEAATSKGVQEVAIIAESMDPIAKSLKGAFALNNRSHLFSDTVVEGSRVLLYKEPLSSARMLYGVDASRIYAITLTPLTSNTTKVEIDIIIRLDNGRTDDAGEQAAVQANMLLHSLRLQFPSAQ